MLDFPRWKVILLWLIVALGVFPGAVFNVTDDAVQVISKAFVAEGH